MKYVKKQKKQSKKAKYKNIALPEEIYAKSKRKELYQRNKKQAIKLYMEENSAIAVERMLEIGKYMYIHWIKEFAKEI